MILPGSVFAILYPDWTYLYPAFNFMNIYSYIWHALLVAYPLMLVADNRIRPKIKHIHYDLLFLMCVVPPIYVFDKVYSSNYLFINWPPENSPLSWIASFMGNPGYLAGYLIFVVLILLLVYFIYSLIDFTKKR